MCILIKKVSDQHGGDDIEILRKHCREVIEAHPDEKIEDAITVYAELIQPLKYY